MLASHCSSVKEGLNGVEQSHPIQTQQDVEAILYKAGLKRLKRKAHDADDYSLDQHNKAVILVSGLTLTPLHADKAGHRRHSL